VGGHDDEQVGTEHHDSFIRLHGSSTVHIAATNYDRSLPGHIVLARLPYGAYCCYGCAGRSGSDARRASIEANGICQSVSIDSAMLVLGPTHACEQPFDEYWDAT
jgi:hypothetical protein